MIPIIAASLLLAGQAAAPTPRATATTVRTPPLKPLTATGMGSRLGSRAQLVKLNDSPNHYKVTVTVPGDACVLATLTTADIAAVKAAWGPWTRTDSGGREPLYLGFTAPTAGTGASFTIEQTTCRNVVLEVQ